MKSGQQRLFCNVSVATTALTFEGEFHEDITTFVQDTTITMITIVTIACFGTITITVTSATANTFTCHAYTYICIEFARILDNQQHPQTQSYLKCICCFELHDFYGGFDDMYIFLRKHFGSSARAPTPRRLLPHRVGVGTPRLLHGLGDRSELVALVSVAARR